MLTKSALLALLNSKGIITKRSLGQNFLIDHNFLKFIIKTAQVTSDDYILEIGSGPGLLTNLISQNARSVWAVEIDKKLIELAQSIFPSLSNVCWLNMSILDKNNNVINSCVIKELNSPSLKVISNLPYATSAQIILALLESNLPINSMVLMVQSEMAERLTAPIGTKAYNALTILVNLLADIKIIRKIPPEVFFPTPEVTSALIMLKPLSSRNNILDYEAVKKLIQAIFHYRRKTIGSALKHITKLPSQKITALLAKSGIESHQRPEQIPAQNYLNLCKAGEILA